MTEAATMTDAVVAVPATTAPPAEVGPLGLSNSTWLWIRRALMGAYVVGTYLLLKSSGKIPIDREIIVGWIAGLALLATAGRRRREALVTLASWAPFLLALFLYDFARAVGHWLHTPVAVTPQIAVDRFLGGGRLWTERLQGWLIDKDSMCRVSPSRRTVASDGVGCAGSWVILTGHRQPGPAWPWRPSGPVCK